MRVFRSKAKYYEPAGAVSWDVAMTATPENWRVGVRKGDVVSTSATYDTRRSSWYESMGIMPVAFDAGGTGPDPFATNVDVPGEVTHGHLAENRNHGGAFGGLPDARRLLSAPPAPSRTVPVSGFLYGQGDLGLTGRKGRPPTIRPGQTLRFVNRDAKRNIFHTITSCKAPCNGATGIAYPLANGPVRFDSGNLGFGPEGRTAAAQRISWRTPKKIRPGTYTYFCRVHPFMRGAFRVAGRARRPRLAGEGATSRAAGRRPARSDGACAAPHSPPAQLTFARPAGPSAPRPGGRSPRARAAPARTWRSSPHEAPGVTKIRRAARPAASSRPRQRGRREPQQRPGARREREVGAGQHGGEVLALGGRERAPARQVALAVGDRPRHPGLRGGGDARARAPAGPSSSRAPSGPTA